MACMMTESFDLAPELIFAELLTMTDVNGKPPINPVVKFPTPCAISSLFVFDSFLSGSILSMASIPNNVSKLATTANVIAIIQNVLVPIFEKFGTNRLSFISEKD